MLEAASPLAGLTALILALVTNVGSYWFPLWSSTPPPVGHRLPAATVILPR